MLYKLLVKVIAMCYTVTLCYFFLFLITNIVFILNQFSGGRLVAITIDIDLYIEIYWLV